ncbi:MAG TPA: universal stress protein [Candidatus Acidoferrum sp.]|nr:universal stress protein [Candidatus Acidoferrum sp.]
MQGRRQNSPFQKILVGFDGSAQAGKAAETALSLAQALDGRVILLAVARPPEPATSVEMHAMLDDAREHYEQDFVKFRVKAQEMGLELETAIAVGHPAEQIIRRAEMDHVDLILLGRRGMSRFEKWILGSISERVLRYAHCPVMVVR